MRGKHTITIAVSAALSFALAACGSSAAPATTSTPPSTPSTSTPSTSTSSASTGTTGPAPVEVNPPGDIPDNQTFVAFRTSAFTVTVPEGWARTAQGSDTVFTDKYNSIDISSLSATNAPTASSAQGSELPTIRARAKGFVAGKVSSVQRTAGTALLITYRAQSPVNPVTGKVAIQAVERYEFWRAGREVVLTLAAPVGSDNVDPWRKVTDSFAWSGK